MAEPLLLYTKGGAKFLKKVMFFSVLTVFGNFLITSFYLLTSFRNEKYQVLSDIKSNFRMKSTRLFMIKFTNLLNFSIYRSLQERSDHISTGNRTHNNKQHVQKNYLDGKIIFNSQGKFTWESVRPFCYTLCY